RLREGDLVTNTDGMLPEADLVFLDELLNANSAVLNSLLMVLNERVFRRGRETRALPMLMAVGASNRLPEDETLRALFDRFLVRVRSDNVADDRLSDVLIAGWKLDDRTPVADPFPIAGIRHLRQAVREVDLTAVRPVYAGIISRLRRAGIPLSDRRAVRLQGLVAASAILCGRTTAQISDCWVLRHTWDTEEQRELLEATVSQALEQAQESAADHPQARKAGAPDAEVLAGEVIALDAELAVALSDAATSSRVRDRLSLLLCRLPWITNSTARSALQQQADAVWARLSTP
ncbi:MAG TPA: AAA family ATPase, partial [Planctomycetota bacterium]|nr:AAA family ATPase [Planctomycetota bacterium]